MVIMGKEAIIIKNVEFDFKEFQTYVLDKIKDVVWESNSPHTRSDETVTRENKIELEAHPDAHGDAPGSMWCTVYLNDYWVSKIESTCGCKVHPEFYLWNFLDYKKLHMHIDANTFGYGRNAAAILPIEEDFILNIHVDPPEGTPQNGSQLDSPIAYRQQYGPGQLCMLNNSEYWHSGDITSHTRKSLHFYLDLVLPKKKEGKWSMQEILDKGKTVDEVNSSKL